MKIYQFVLLVFTCISSLLSASDPQYFTVSPKKGDGVITLLARYSLDQNSCDIDQFYKVNKLDKNDDLFTHKMYKLPVFIYTYNDKSIRSTINDDNWDKAVRIKEYNEKLQESGVRSTHYTESKFLWVPYSELHCDNSDQTRIIEASEPNILKVPYFGEDYQRVEIIDYSLKGNVYYIVSGHGGPDPGAMCVDCPETMCEDEYAYDIALRLGRELMQHGATVHMIIQDSNDGIRDAKFLKCDKDEKLLGKNAMPLNQLRRLNQRAAAINKLYREHKKRGAKEQVAVFIHVDSNNANKKQDVYFYHHKTSKSGKKIANNILKTFDQKYEKYQSGRGYEGHVSPRGLYVLNYTQPTSVFIELGNIRNKSDHRRLLLNSNRQALAKWLGEGLAK